MNTLERAFRIRLEQAIKQARDIAEVAARTVLEQLGVGEASPPSFLKPEERELRRQLRIHGRQLGDTRNPKTDVQEIDCLVEEVSYQHWHRMLFARFLAENDLLIYPSATAVSITLEECEDLAGEEGARDGWELASRFAAQMLPQIFVPSSPVFKLVFPAEQMQKLEELVSGLPKEVFVASDSLGWIYQYWQSKKRDDVINSEVKIGGRELPSVTQLFTEPYMVSFLLDNSLGAWWAARRLTSSDLRNAKSEEELRAKSAIPGLPLNYLRFVRQPDSFWKIASGEFGTWPKLLSEFKTIDPCCGSGHFLVATLLMLVPMRMELEGLSPCEAVELVLAENIYGLELDRRCVELAAFALALTSWRYPGAGGYRVLPALNVACSGLSFNIKKDEWLALTKQCGAIAEEIFDLFGDAPTLGSLVNPIVIQKSDGLAANDWSSIQVAITAAIDKVTEDGSEIGVVAKGIAHAASILCQQHHLVLTNVPYLKRSKQSQTLRQYCDKHHGDAQHDLATVFLDRCLTLCAAGGTACIVLPQNWLFLTSYQKFRERLLTTCEWNLIARLGPKAFQTQMWDFNVQLLLITRGICESSAGCISGVDVSSYATFSEKDSQLPLESMIQIVQRQQLDNPDSAVQFEGTENTVRLSEYANCYQGSGLADIARFRCFFWEIMSYSPSWVLHQSSPSGVGEFSGLKFITLWEDGKGAMARSPQVTIRGRKAWKRKGVSCAWMGNLPVSLYGGWLYDNSAAAIIPNNEEDILPIWSFCSSPKFNEEVRKINQKLQVANATMVKVPFDIDFWRSVASQKYPNGLPKAYSNDPTQWVFHGHPCGTVLWNEETKKTEHGELRSEAVVLQVAVARLMGYKWPAEQNEELELADEQRDLVKKCAELSKISDEDGIVCLPALRGELSGSDKLENILATSYGTDWNHTKLNELLRQCEHEGKSLESWLQDKFFIQHCQLFQNRPFIWHVWDGLRDGFGVLINYHKFDHKLLEALIYTYLGDWMRRQKLDIDKGVDGAHEKLAAAEQLKKRLELIKEGESPYDIFVRWKALERQPLGWKPDINDGVRVNIRPFLMVPDVGKKGAGILRDKPNINWENDRGKDTSSAPWYHLFKGERVNDHHVSLKEKLSSRAGERIEVCI